MATSFAPALPHGDVEEIFPDVFFVTGTTKPTFGGADWQFSRNMIVVREGSGLTLISSVRLDERGLGQLEALGEIAHVIKLGAFHGMDDAFYCDRYGARQWALPGMKLEGDRSADEQLGAGGAIPFAGASLFTFETSLLPEGLIVLERAEGIAIACDSLQNWTDVDPYFDEGSAERMRAMGFIQPANIGPGWMAACKPAASDFDRIETLAFRHLLPSHGRPLRDQAKVELAATFRRTFAG